MTIVHLFWATEADWELFLSGFAKELGMRLPMRLSSQDDNTETVVWTDDVERHRAVREYVMAHAAGVDWRADLIELVRVLSLRKGGPCTLRAKSGNEWEFDVDGWPRDSDAASGAPSVANPPTSDNADWSSTNVTDGEGKERTSPGATAAASTLREIGPDAAPDAMDEALAKWHAIGDELSANARGEGSDAALEYAVSDGATVDQSCARFLALDQQFKLRNVHGYRRRLNTTHLSYDIACQWHAGEAESFNFE
ncbi:hypothetical protein PENSPDRAFT_668023 [Peniophora sp. CONT]|nr:hypothetical protein PENSPDRAFT_668023 [Peniophora sp. CONT]